jgi:HSP20 family protein
VKIWQCGERLLVEAELPGVKPDRIDISVSGGELSIRAERPDEPPEGAIYHRRERPRGATERVLRLPVDVDTSKVEASLTDGILTISLPKAESAKPRKIPVAFNAPAESPPPGP